MLKLDTRLEARGAVPGTDLPNVHFDSVRAELEDLFVEVNALGVRLRQIVRGSHADGDLASGAQDVLQILSDSDGQTVPQIARIRVTSRQNIQILVNGLKSHGFVELTSNPAHKKSALVRITAPGRDFLAMVIAGQEKFRINLLPHFSESELSGAVKLLRRLRQLLSARPGAAETLGSGLEGPIEKPPGPTRRKQPDSNELPAWTSQFDENELPVNLL